MKKMEPITPIRIAYDGNISDYSVDVEKAGEWPIYTELAVVYTNVWTKKRVADVYITVDRVTLEPKILITTNGDGDGEHQIVVRPLLPKHKAVTYDE